MRILLRKGFSKLPFYCFNKLQKYFPKLTSIEEFLTSDSFLNQVQVQVEGTVEQVGNLSNKDKLIATIQVLDEIAKRISDEHIRFNDFGG